MIKGFLIIAVAFAIAVALPKTKRQVLSSSGYPASPQTYVLPDGVDLIVGPYRSTFSCLNRIYGYYADQDNNCQIFHVCNPVVLADGQSFAQQFSFFCPNQTVFDQKSLVCASPQDAVPCQEAHNYLGVNSLFFITERPPQRYAPATLG